MNALEPRRNVFRWWHNDLGLLPIRNDHSRVWRVMDGHAIDIGDNLEVWRRLGINDEAPNTADVKSPWTSCVMRESARQELRRLKGAD